MVSRTPGGGGFQPHVGHTTTTTTRMSHVQNLSGGRTVAPHGGHHQHLTTAHPLTGST